MSKNCTHLKATKMKVPKDDSRDPQFHLNILDTNKIDITKNPKK